MMDFYYYLIFMVITVPTSDMFMHFFHIADRYETDEPTEILGELTRK
jgi:hypothetical protein